MEIIREWFNGTRNYQVGVQLYLQFGQDIALKAFFQNGHTPFREQKLAEEMKALLLGPEPEMPATEIQRSAYELSSNIGSSDPIIEELYRQKSLLHKKKDLLRHSLENLPTDTERGVVAHQILKLRQQITDIWQQEVYYKQHGRLPEQDAGVTDPVMLKYRRNMVNTNIRRLRSQLKKDPDNKGYQASLTKFEAEHAAIKEKIKRFKHLIDG